MDDEIELLEVLKSDENGKLSLSKVSLLDRVVSLFPSVFKKEKSSEDMDLLTSSTPDITMELEIPEPSEDTQMLTSDSEINMEFESPETSENLRDTGEQASGNSLSDKFKDFFNLGKKFESLSIKKVVNSHALVEPKNLDELGVDLEDHFIENYQYYEDLPYLEIRDNDNRETDSVDTVDTECYNENSTNFNCTIIAKNCANFDSCRNVANKNESEGRKMDSEGMEIGDVKENNEDYLEGKMVKEVDTDNEEGRKKSPKENSSMESDNSSMDSDNSNMEDCNISNSDMEDNGILIIRIAKKISTIIFKALTNSYAEDIRRLW